MTWSAKPILAVPDVDAARTYFTDVLGFSCDGSHEPAGEMVYAIVSRDGATLHLQIRRRDLGLDAREDHETDAFVIVDDVDALFHECTKNAVPIHRSIQDEPYGMRDFTIELPSGPRVAFATPTDELKEG